MEWPTPNDGAKSATWIHVGEEGDHAQPCHTRIRMLLVAFSLLNQASAQQPGDVQSNSVIVCEHSEFLGHCETFTLEPGKRHVLVPNPFALKGKISSIAVGYDLETWVFTGVYFSGTSAVIDRTKETLEVHLDGRVGV